MGIGGGDDADLPDAADIPTVFDFLDEDRLVEDFKCGGGGGIDAERVFIWLRYPRRDLSLPPLR